VTYPSEIGLGTRKKCRAGLDFVHGELIVCLWFAIGLSHVSERLIPPSSQSEKRRDAAADLNRMMCTDKSFIINTEILVGKCHIRKLLKNTILSKYQYLIGSQCT